MARTCAYCAQDFTPSTSVMRYCSPLCRNRGKYAAKKADGRYARQLERKRDLYQPRPPRPAKPPRLCSVDGCERTHHGNGMCKMHLRRGNRKPEPWTDRARDRYHQRRARLHGAHNSDTVLLSHLTARDHHCGWCGQPIDQRLTYPNPMSRSIDHVTPLSRGGQHTLANTRLLHLRCNSQRGNRAEITRPDWAHAEA